MTNLERARVKKKRRYNLWESVFFLVMVLLALYILLRSPVFEVREVTVTGNRYMPAEKIISVSGIVTGENIFKINLQQAAGRVEIIPMLKSVEMDRELPSRVVIRVVERSPLALLPAGEGFIQVDADGVYLQKGSPSDRNLPVITGVKAGVPPPGQPVRADGLTGSIKVIREMPADLIPELSEVNIDPQGNVIIYTMDGVQCRMGRIEEMAEKGLKLSWVLGELKNKNKKIEYVDLSYVGSPVVKYVQ